jgi:hypothetical protein
MRTSFFGPALLLATLFGCGSDGGTNPDGENPVTDSGITPSANADLGSSYENAKADIWIGYSALPRPGGALLGDAIAYLDADGDGDTDVFLGTGEFLNAGEVPSEVFLNDGANSFTFDTGPFGGDMPPATHARKSLAADFNGDALTDLFVLDHGFDSDPFPGSVPKLIIQNTAGAFTWSKLTAQTGFHHGGAAADIDNDGDVDVFVGGFDPFFYVNDGAATFTKVDDRFDGSIDKVFTAELIDVDEDGFVDLLVGAHERDGDQTSVYWGSSTGSYTSGLRTIVPSVASMGAVLDIEAEDVDSDGDRDLIVNRTRDGDDGANSGFYQGRRLQLVLQGGSRTFTDVTFSQIDDPGTDVDAWLPWLRARDVDTDGDLDIVGDNMDRGFFYLNDGNGHFTKTSVVP